MRASSKREHSRGGRPAASRPRTSRLRGSVRSSVAASEVESLASRKSRCSELFWSSDVAAANASAAVGSAAAAVDGSPFINLLCRASAFAIFCRSANFATPSRCSRRSSAGRDSLSSAQHSSMDVEAIGAVWRCSSESDAKRCDSCPIGHRAESCIERTDEDGVSLQPPAGGRHADTVLLRNARALRRQGFCEIVTPPLYAALPAGCRRIS